MADVSIGTIQELVAFSNGDYGRGASGSPISVVLTADLDFNDLKEYDNPYNWAGCTGTWYVNFDGQGHKIDNIYYVGTGTWALFDTIGGSIKNLKLTNVYATANSNIAGFVRSGIGVRIENCAFSGYLESLYEETVGYINRNDSTTNTIRNCSYSGTMKANVLYKSCNTWVGHQGGNTAHVSNSIFVGNLISVQGNCTFFGSCATYVNCEFRGVIQPARGLYYRAYNGSIYNCLAITEQGSYCGWYVGDGSAYNSYYDSDKASATGLTGIGLTPATTAELHDTQWLRNHGIAI